MEHPVLLYDGLCGLCNRAVQFVLRHDHEKIFRFASLQSVFASRILAQKELDSRDLTSMYIVVFCQEQQMLLQRSDAVVYVLERLGPGWRALAWLLQLFPRALRDWTYGWVARCRYRLFGKYESCPLPSGEYRERFLDA